MNALTIYADPAVGLNRIANPRCAGEWTTLFQGTFLNGCEVKPKPRKLSNKPKVSSGRIPRLTVDGLLTRETIDDGGDDQ